MALHVNRSGDRVEDWRGNVEELVQDTVTGGVKCVFFVSEFFGWTFLPLKLREMIQFHKRVIAKWVQTIKYTFGF